MNLPFRRDPVPKQNQPDDEYLKRLASLKEAVGETSYFTSEQLVNAKTKYQDMQNKLAGYVGSDLFKERLEAGLNEVKTGDDLTGIVRRMFDMDDAGMAEKIQKYAKGRVGENGVDATINATDKIGAFGEYNTASDKITLYMRQLYGMGGNPDKTMAHEIAHSIFEKNSVEYNPAMQFFGKDNFIDEIQGKEYGSVGKEFAEMFDKSKAKQIAELTKRGSKINPDYPEHVAEKAVSETKYSRGGDEIIGNVWGTREEITQEIDKIRAGYYGREDPQYRNWQDRLNEIDLKSPWETEFTEDHYNIMNWLHNRNVNERGYGNRIINNLEGVEGPDKKEAIIKLMNIIADNQRQGKASAVNQYFG